MLPCYTREERGGLRIIMPLEGQRRFDSTFVNRTAAFVFDRLQAGRDVAGLAADLETTYPDVPAERLRLDLFKTLATFEGYDLCRPTLAEWLSLLPAQAAVPGEVQVMPPQLAPRVASFLRAAYEPDGDAAREPAALFYGMELACPCAGGDPLAPERLLLRQAQGQELLLVDLDRQGRVSAVAGVPGLGAHGAALQFSRIAARAPARAAFVENVCRFFGAVELFLQTATPVCKTRLIVLQHHESGAWLSIQGCPEFEQVLGRCGYRREAVLRHEVAWNQDLVLYSRLIR